MQRDKLKWYQALAIYDEGIEVHWFPLEPNTARSTYPAGTSIGHFHNRLEQRDAPKGLLVDFEPLRRVFLEEHLRQARENYRYMFDECPHYFQNSLWDFYVSIGFDIKTKKWGERPPLDAAMTFEQLELHCHKIDQNFGDHKEYAINFKRYGGGKSPEAMREIII